MNVDVSDSDRASWEQHHIDRSMQLLRQGRVGEVGRGEGEVQGKPQALVYDILLEEGARKRCSECGCRANSKHWFTTSFLQPLPYLVMS